MCAPWDARKRSRESPSVNWGSVASLRHYRSSIVNGTVRRWEVGTHKVHIKWKYSCLERFHLITLESRWMRDEEWSDLMNANDQQKRREWEDLIVTAQRFILQNFCTVHAAQDNKSYTVKRSDTSLAIWRYTIIYTIYLLNKHKSPVDRAVSRRTFVTCLHPMERAREGERESSSIFEPFVQVTISKDNVSKVIWEAVKQ